MSEPHSDRTPSANRLDLIVAGSAVLIAVLSLVVSVRQSQIMDRQLAASAWPHLQFDTSNELDGKRIIGFQVENAGVGPALIHTMTIDYEGKPVRTAQDLISYCCQDLEQSAGKSSWTTSTVHDHVLTASRTVYFLTLTDAPQNDAYWQRLNADRNKVNVRICYCSVLDQCWMLDSTQPEQHSVASCPATRDSDYQD